MSLTPGTTGVTRSPAIDEPVGQGQEIDTPTIRHLPEIPSAERCHLCDERVVMFHEGRKYCAVHGKEKLMEDK